jgi:uncharacterized protein (TIGR02271 family)
MKTVVGLFEDRQEAQRAVADLRNNGFAERNVSVLTSAADSAEALRDLANDISEPDIRFYEEGVRRGGHLVVVRADDRQAPSAAAILAKYNMIDIDARAAEYRTAGSDYRLRDYDDQDVVLPVVEEELRVGKRAVERGRMRVYTRVTERPVEEQVQLREETVRVERRPVDRPVSDADLDAMGNREIEVTAMAEEAVVSKTARVIEEVVVGKQVTERTETVRDTVRRTEVDVERNEAERAVGTSGYETFDADFRSFYNTNLTKSGYTYDQYSPVFRYGYGLSTDDRYRGKQWREIESDARRSWEERNPNTWDQFKDSVRYAWERATQQR